MSKVHEKIIAEVEAKSVAAELIQISAAAEQMKDQLKQYVKEYGDLVIGNQVFTFVDTVSWDMSADVMKELFLSLAVDGVNPYDYASISSGDLKKLGYTEDVLLSMGAVKKKQERFGLRAYKPEQAGER